MGGRSFRSICGLVLVMGWSALAVGCASVPKRMERHLDREEFEEARALLERQRAGETVGDGVTRNALQARKTFTSRVEAQTFSEANRVGESAIDPYCEAIHWGFSLAPWSAPIRDRASGCDERLKRLEAMMARWSEPPATREEARRALSDLRPLGTDLGQRPELVGAYEAAENVILEHWLHHWARGESFVPRDGDSGFWEDIEALGPRGLRYDRCLRAAVRLSQAHESEGGFGRLGTALDEASTCVALPPASYEEERARRISKAGREWISRWLENELPGFPGREEASFETISLYEDFIQSHPTLANETFRCGVGNLHLRLAERRAGMGAASVLAFFYGARAKELCEEIPSTSVEEIQSRALKSLGASGGFVAQISIVADPQVDPEAYELVRMAMISSLRSRTRPGFRWEFLPPGRRSEDANIFLHRVDLRLPDYDSLPKIRSSYYSHDEEVPNPQKQTLRARLESQKRNVELAESSLDSAIMRHNYYPTSSSLQVVNAARSNYALQIDIYNSLVNQFNATRSTVTRPVYIPYFYSEGTIELGWGLGFSYEIGAKRGRTVAQSFDRARVRVGTRYNDRDSNRRVDVEPDFEMSIERWVEHLVSAVNEALDEMAASLSNVVELRFAAGLTEEELEAVRWAFHPMGTTREMANRMAVAPWFVNVSERIELPDFEAGPPTILVSAPPLRPRTPLDAAEAARFFEGLVGEIIAEGPRGSSISSGAIISGDGLILTCAHGLEGARLSIRFTSGAWAGTYPVEIEFVHEASDTAVLRAKGLRTNRWMEVRLEAPAQRGEGIVAIGNPSLGGGSRSVEAITQGIVSNPESEFYGSPRLVADIGIASGSSGGPIVALRDGKIIGVTTAVARPEFGEHRASTKSVALAAPAQRLVEWLGLERAAPPRAPERR